MRRVTVVTLICVGLLLISAGTYTVVGQENEDPHQQPIFTTATESVGLGTYVAAEAYANPAGEDPAEEPVVAIILPYGIYPAMEVDVIEDFEQPEPTIEGFTFEWSLLPAEGSEAELMDGNVAIFMADVEGPYELTLTATDENGNSGETTWVVYASTYTGNGFLREANEDDPTQCIDCHEDTMADWAVTAHADTFIRAIDGELSDHFESGCVSCHTTGYNSRATEVNGGFHDLAEDAGWMLPTELTEGNWDAMVEEHPGVAGMANVQCEACHGPGNLHTFEASRNESMIGYGLNYGTCAQCHGEEPYLTIPQQWEISGHADTNSRSFTYPIGEDRGSCVNCHSGYGYLDAAAGLPQEEWRTDYQVITCAVCHDPHNAENPNQLRVFDEMVLPSGLDVTDAGPSATCMSCHNARRDGPTVVAAALDGERFGTPHYSTGAELLNDAGGYTWGMEMPSSGHASAVDNTCIGCHMAPTVAEQLPGHDEVGEHTFAMTSEDGVENLAACTNCHDGETSFDFEAFRDYDGDGTIETNQAEIDGLRTLVADVLIEAGVGVLDHHPYYELPEGADENIMGAVWNHKFTESSGSAAHNLRYTVGLLQTSYQMLVGEPVPDAYLIVDEME